MDENLMSQENPATMTQHQPKRRGRQAGMRKSGFKMTTPPYPVKAIWEMATPEQQKAAHQMGVLMLEHWLGRISRRQLAEQTKQPPLRIWQMSQQALSGMVVGLMAQPKRPPKGTPMPTDRTEPVDVKALQRELAELRRDNQVLQDLVNILKDMPAQQKTVDMPKGEKKETQPANPLAASPRNLSGKPSQAQG